jgi:hypothetical protein
MEDDPRKLSAKAELRRAYVHLIKLKAHRAAGLETQASRLSPMVVAGWLSEAEVYTTFRQASAHNGLAGIDTPQAMDRCIREGLENGKLLPLPAEWADVRKPALSTVATVSTDPNGYARLKRWRAAHRKEYNLYMKGYRALRAAKRQRRSEAS